MSKITFSTTSCFDMADGFGCASLGLPGICDNDAVCVSSYGDDIKSVILTGSYGEILESAEKVTEEVFAAIVLFGNAGGENVFMRQFQKIFSCPMVGGGAAIDTATGRSALITGGGQAAVMLITDDRYMYVAQTKCIHDQIVEECTIKTADPRTILTINGVDAATYLASKKKELGFAETDYEHMTLSDMRGVNAHLSCENGVIKSGRDVCEKMILRYVKHEDVYESMRSFYDDEKAIVFGCAGLSGLLDRPLDTTSLGLFLFGEICCVDGVSEFGNLMLSKLIIEGK